MLSGCVQLPDDTVSEFLLRALEDYRSGFLFGAQLAEAVGAAVTRVQEGDERARVCELEASVLTDKNDELEARAKKAEWQLEVALKALDDLRTKIGEHGVKIEFASERMASDVCKPSAVETSAHAASVARSLKELYTATKELHLVEGDTRGFRNVAARFDLERKEP